MNVNEQERLSTFTLGKQIKIMEQHFYCKYSMLRNISKGNKF
jgi:hypothetical protein